MKKATKVKNKIYLDHASATPLDPQVYSAMKNYWSINFGNPGSIHSLGLAASVALEESRKKIAMLLGARSSEIVFTSGGTESDNLAVIGVANIFKKNSNGARLHLITTEIEHHAVLNPIKYLESAGFEVTYLKASEKGVITAEQVRGALQDNTVLVSVIYANNEIGTIQPIREIGNVIKKTRGDRPYPVFHTDACQAPGSLNLQVSNLGIDLMTISSSKIYGPKGAGLLYVKTGTPIDPVFLGGGQEGGLRPGTQAVPLIVGFAIALELAENKKAKEATRMIETRDYFIKSMLGRFKNIKLNGDAKLRLPNNANFYFPGVTGEQLVIELDVRGILASTGSACNSREEAPSHVVSSIYGEKRAESSVRFTLGRSTTKKDASRVIEVLDSILKRIG
jgi:cysteine desulfurase